MAVLTNTMLQGSSAVEDEETYEIQKSVEIRQDLRSNFKTGMFTGNRFAWTWSAWVKRNNVGSGNHCYLFAALPTSPDSGSNEQMRCMFATSDNRIQLYQKTGNSVTCDVEAKAVMRDPSAWCHVVVVWDTANDDPKERVRMYINGVQQEMSITASPSQWRESKVNRTFDSELMSIGGFLDAGTWRGLDGKLANVHFIDGCTLSPAAFGTFNSLNQWNPAAFALPTPNTGKGAWSGMVSGDSLQSSYPATAGFDGKDGYKTGMAVDGAGTATFTPTGGITAKSEIKIHIYMRGNSRTSNYDLKVNGKSVFNECYNYTSPGANQWRWFPLPTRTLTTLQFGGEGVSAQWMRIGCIEVDGVILQDNTTDETDRKKIWPGANTGQDYGIKFNANSLVNSGNANTIMDGSELTQLDVLQHATNYVTLTDNTAIVATSSVGVFTYTGNSTPTLRVTNTSGQATVFNGVTNSAWTDWSYTGTIKKIELGYLGGTGSVNTFRGVRVDGVPVVNRGRDNSFHLEFNKDGTVQDLGWSSFNPKLSEATGGLPIYNTTDDYGHVKGSGYRTDNDAADLLLAIPGDTIEDVSHSIRGSGSALAITTHGPVGTSNERSRFYGTSMCFNDRAEWLSCTNSDFAFGTGDFTIECWVWLDEALDADTGIFQLSDTSGGLDTGTTNTAILYITGSGWKINANDAPRYVNIYTKSFAWNHVAYVRHSGTTTLYVNGAAGLDNHADTANLTGTHLAIGCYYNSNYAHRGFINDFRVYDKAKYTSNFNVALPYEFAVGHESSPGDGNRIVKMTASATEDYFGKATSGATGAKPILVTTDTYGSVTSGATRTHSTSNLLLAIPCNTTANCSVDKSSHDRTVTNTGSIEAVNHDNPYYGGAAYFKDGTDELVCDGGSDFNFGGSSNPTDFTAEMWVHCDGSQSHGLIDTRTSGADSNGFMLTLQTSGQIIFYTAGAWKMYTKEGAFKFNRWNHIALQRETNTWKLYINGKLRGNADYDMHPNRGTWRFGKAHHTTGEGVKGYMQDIRLYATKKYSGEFVVTRPAIPAKNVDVSVDTPTNYLPEAGNDALGGVTRGNYCTWNPLDKTSGVTLERGNLYAYGDNSEPWETIKATQFVSSGKFYFEADVLTDASGSANGNAYQGLGVVKSDTVITAGNPSTQTVGAWYGDNGWTKFNNGTWTEENGKWLKGDVIGVAIDCSARSVTFYRNNSQQATASSLWTDGEFVGPGLLTYDDAYGAIQLNFGQRPFKYTAPANHKCLCTQNHSDLFSGAQLNNPSKYFDVTTWYGTGSAMTIKGYDFQPDIVWYKGTDGTNNGEHMLFDAARGATHGLHVDYLVGGGWTNANTLSAFNSDGFSLGADHSLGSKEGSKYVGWCWDAGTAAATASTEGSITPDAQWVNSTVGLSISKFENVANSQTIGHGLSVEPDLIITKNIDNALAFQIYHKSAGSGAKLYFSNSAAVSSSMWGSGPDNDVFTYDDGNTGTCIAYCWAAIPNFSAFGSYEGNDGNGTGPFVYTGFRPRYVMIKSMDQTQDWIIHDSVRGGDNVVYNYLKANSNGSENTTENNNCIDILSNGFIPRAVNTANAAVNEDTLVYLAFAEHPFKIARAR